MAVPASVKQHVDQALADVQKTYKIVSAWNTIKEELVQSKLANYVNQCPNNFFAPHLLNRSGEMLDAERVHNVGRKIVEHGFSFEKAEMNAVCFEAPTHDPAQLAENLAEWKRTCAMSNGYLPAITYVEPRYFTVGSSHSVQFLNCVQNGVVTMHDELAKSPPDSMVLDKERLLSDKSLRQAVEGGFKWLVISSVVESTWGAPLVDLIQNVLNSTAEDRQSEVEVINLHRKVPPPPHPRAHANAGFLICIFLNKKRYIEVLRAAARDWQGMCIQMHTPQPAAAGPAHVRDPQGCCQI